MRRQGIFVFVLGLISAACINDPRRTAVPPPGGEQSGYNGTAGVSTMRYAEPAAQPPAQPPPHVAENQAKAEDKAGVAHRNPAQQPPAQTATRK